MKSLIVVSLHACFYANNFPHKTPEGCTPLWQIQGCDPNNSLGKPAPHPARNLHLRGSFRKSVSIYPRSTPGFCLKFMGCL